MTPDHSQPWWQDAVVYQIYPRSFQDSNGDGVGDLEGIISRLDHLNDGTPQSLGVDAIWLSPVYPSPMKDFGYDISDYDNIDPVFGDLDTFDRLLVECHRRCIRVIMDLVVNHTSDEHPWFEEARSSPASAKHDWYLWASPRKGLFSRPNNWLACFELRSAWWWQPECEQYYLATFTRHQPELNWRNPSVRQAIYGMMQRWFDRGVDGFRLDVINYVVKDDRLRSNPWSRRAVPDLFQKHLYDRNRPESHDVCREMRQLADAAGDKMLVGEIFANDPPLVAGYLGDGDELHMAFNFAFLSQPWSARQFKAQALAWYDLLEQRGWPCFTLSNHDQPRHFSRYDDDGAGEARARVAAIMLLTLRGTPFLYYGEEIGMRQARLTRSQIQDPLGKRVPWLSRDGSRTPMQWDTTAHAGFTELEPWLPVNDDRVSVAGQLADDESLLSLYRRLIWLRRGNEVLRRGDIRFLDNTPDDVLAYDREWRGEKVRVILNFAGELRHFAAHDPVSWTVLLASSADSSASVDGALNLRAHEGLVLGLRCKPTA